MIDILMILPIVPRGQPAPRAFVVPGGAGKPTARLFQPKDAAQWKSDLRVLCAPHQPGVPIDGSVRLDFLAVMPRPKNLFRKKDPPGLIDCTSKPDVDNIRKAIQDALNKIWWRDDAIICAGQSLKAFAEKDGHPRLSIRVRAPAGVAEIARALGLAAPSNGAPAVQGELGDLPLLQHAIDMDDARDDALRPIRPPILPVDQVEQPLVDDFDDLFEEVL